MVEDKEIKDTEIVDNRINVRITKVIDGVASSRYIQLDDFVYIKDQQDGKWWKGRRSPTSNTNNLSTANINAAKYENLNLAGEEQCGTHMCYVYEEKNPAITKLTNEKFWIDKDEFLLRQEQYDVGVILFTVAFTYNTNFSPITIPSPTKDIPEGAKVSDYYLKYYVHDP